MADQKLPSFKDLEPEGEPFKESGDPAGAQEFADEEFDEFIMGPLGDYEFGDRDEFADFEAFEALGEFEALVDDEFLDDDRFFEDGHFWRHRGTLATRAARTAFKWGGHAKTASPLKDNSRKPKTSKLTGLPTESCSATVREAHELMAALATAAAATEDETEAMGLVAAMVPVSVGLAPNAYRALWLAIPVLVRGAMGVTRLLHRRPDTRSHIKLMPRIMQGTTAQLAQHALRRYAIPQRLAAKVLANETAAALSCEQEGSRPVPRRPRRSRSRSYDRYDRY